jgi:hypothetical protein
MSPVLNLVFNNRASSKLFDFVEEAFPFLLYSYLAFLSDMVAGLSTVA